MPHRSRTVYVVEADVRQRIPVRVRYPDPVKFGRLKSLDSQRTRLTRPDITADGRQMEGIFAVRVSPEEGRMRRLQKGQTQLPLARSLSLRSTLAS
ncbi:hypothetical protein BHE74_00024084 [Ensete ventricosum]|nr:hypothetical protein BHE74_00024084 [Ensete ventricosum]RZR80894.1 hypothetical protein BHM03_00007002 [Ensete ventricosum]